MFKLVIQDDEGKTTVVPLIRDEITIGRKEGNTIRLTERNVSRRHARIVRNNGEVQIEDLGSYNGIRVNNARIAERVSLRVSDQVQIGDYKLYLKAEGAEQADDARTVPIERIDGPPTEQMTSIPAAPTVPMPVLPNVGRNGLGTVDTDPAGRPVANAAQVAALSQSAAYGRLVVVSSNYAGKEFDLTRSQMIVGRTDENDLVINHRSISRNHAKITRDPETARYTISDLQSSNGVRVNGQEYGKVELRRADVIDLGHVRLRFVEPGEDFVFSRDAVITDVPEAGGKRGVFLAVAVAVLLLAAVAVFFVVSSGSKKDSGAKDDTGMNLANSGGSGVASGDNSGSSGAGSNVAAAEPSDAAMAMVQPPPPNTGSNTGSSDELGQTKIQCLEYQEKKDWQDLTNCADKLAGLDAKTAKTLKDKAKAETGNMFADGKLDDAIKSNDLAAARRQLEKIDDDSVYRKAAQAKFNEFEDKVVEFYHASAIALRKSRKCDKLEPLVQEASAKGGQRAAEAVRGVKCEPAQVAVTPPDHGAPKNPIGAGSGSSATAPPQPPQPPPAACDADALKEKGMNDEGMGQHAAALAQFEAALRCKADARGVQLAFMASCNSGQVAKAKLYYKKLSTDSQSRFAVMCIRHNITKEQLEAP
jgi:pSer/pThr/pTyr-binding forkhead associated (FHA) protein